MRTVGIPVGSPVPAQDDNQQSAITDPSITSLLNSVPPKERRQLFFKGERTPPPKLPFTAILEPDPIYPLIPFLFWSAFGNERASENSVEAVINPPFEIPRNIGSGNRIHPMYWL